MINIKILVTNKCNYNCLFCHDEFQSREERDDRFDPEKLCRVINDHIKQFEVQPLTFKFSGGEPTKNWESLLQLIDLSHQFHAQKRILISNLSRLKEVQMNLLVEMGINEIRVNIPSFVPDRYMLLTGGNSLEGPLNSMQYFKKSGCVVRVNSVLTKLEKEEEVRSHLSEMIDRAKELGFIDEINFIADYYAESEKRLFSFASNYLRQLDNSLIFRRGRIFSGKIDNLKVSVSRCLDRANNEKDDTEIYIIPDGRILSNYVLKR